MCRRTLGSERRPYALLRDPINSGLRKWRMAVLKKKMDAAAELGRDPVSKHQFQPAEYGDERGTGLPNPSRETKFSDANGDREIFIFPVDLTTSRIGNLTRLIHILAMCVTMHTYLHTYLCIHSVVL